MFLGFILVLVIAALYHLFPLLWRAGVFVGSALIFLALTIWAIKFLWYLV